LASWPKDALKWFLFPGLDINTHCRRRFLPRFFRAGPLETLDAGCGNGALSLAAAQKGNHVLGVTLDEDQIRRNRAFFARWGGANPDRLQFEVCNIYELRKLGRKFDQIICVETLEHIARDAEVIAIFHDILNAGGVLHLCCPYALHPKHNLGRTNGPEDGGHVRDGYTWDSYRALLEPAGFRIEARAGLGSFPLEAAHRSIRSIRNRFGEVAALRRSDIVLRDRRALANDGMFMIVVTVDKQTGSVVGRPEIITRGFVHLNEQDPIMKEALERVIESIHTPGDHISEIALLKTQIKDGVSRFLYEQTKRRPMVFPVVVEV
jgi:SAM-dependent methyltransferase